MITANGSLVIVGLNTSNAVVFWNGIEVPNITSIRVDWEQDEQRIKLKVTGSDEAMYAEMLANGIHIKKG